MALKNEEGKAFTSEEISNISGTNVNGPEALTLFLSNTDRTEATLNGTSNDGRNNIELLHILVQAVNCPVNSGGVISLLAIISGSRFYKEGLGLTLGAYNLSDGFKEFCKFLQECADLIELLCAKFPSTIEETATFGIVALLKTKIQDVLPDLDERMRESMCAVSETVSRLQDDIMKKLLSKDRSTKTDSRFEKELPPDDFHKISILPSEKDIILSRVFLRPNKSKGGYDSLHHYLDVQFRLYREDCISPLRDGIVEYVKECSAGRSIGRLQDGRLYKDVVASQEEDSLEGLLVTITIDKHHASRINWRTSHRLIYGSLVCLSPDHFQSMFFAVVTESDRDTLEKTNTFKVRFATGAKHFGCPLNVKLTMVESTAYYESYRHVLSSLQNIREGELPFEKYIVYCKNIVDQPKYLRELESAFYDFQPIVANHAICQQDTLNTRSGVFRSRSSISLGMEQKKVRNVNIFSPVPEWPSPDELHLDESQFEAFHSALTEEFVLIQGPPGTGKTYVGLQIAKTLLHNKSTWTKRTHYVDGSVSKIKEKCPMLIVCFTNHALDQFMEGIISFHDEHSSAWRDEIVRVGGRGESTLVQEFSLKNRRQRHRHTVDEKGYMKEIEKNRRDIAKRQWCLNKTKTVILSPSLLKDVIDEKHYDLFCRKPKKKPKQKNNDEEKIAQWLAATEQNWLRQATRCYSQGIKPATCNEKGLDHSEDTVDIETDVQRAEYDRRIEEDEIVFKFDDTLGLDVEQVLGTLLSKCEYEGIDERLKSLIESEAKHIICRLSSSERMTNEEVKNLKQPLQSLPYEDRWSLYRYWLNKYRVQQNLEMEQLRDYQKSIYKDYEREKQETDARVLKEATVIAMTTTGAARYQNVLREIGPRIIIVEEAAEVLEAHIVATLSSKCEHLILIGDHKQLEPKPSVFELAIRYNIGISMFERMINNELSYHCLQRQHRMRPEISTLVRHIYPALLDNENVKLYDHVKGVKKDVYFISHKQPEQFREDIRSYSNEHEARYIMRLCRYLMLQGYDAKQITVLAAYNGQMFTIRDLMPKSEFFGVRVCAVDNYQGEENDIVLLSLVRSNTTERIGFLKRENRICVALSRAKIGMYVIGNFSILGKGSPMWRKIMNDMRAMQGVSAALPLYCENHPEKIILAKTAEDFDQAPQGGCNMNCDFRLPCGHSCRFRCHPIDRAHEKYECPKKCNEVCRNSHTCQKTCHYGKRCMCSVIMERKLHCKHYLKMECWEDPELKKCTFLVQRTLEKCGHKAEMECFKDPGKFVCKIIVNKTLSCELHDLMLECWVDPKTIPCKVLVQRKLEKCGHEVEMECFTDPEKYKCKVIVNKTLPCEHKADIYCYIKPSSHICKEIVTRKKPCGHTYEVPCYRNDRLYLRLINDRQTCTEITEKTFISCGHTLNVECNVNLNELQCQTVVSKLLDCGHEVNVTCHKQKVAKCTHSCLKVCDNNHVCQSMCHYGTQCECKIKVQKTIPMCGHKQTMFCFSDPLFERCETIIPKKLSNCEHILEMKCGTDAAMVECKQIVSKVVPLCGHKNDMFCHSDPSDFSQCDTLVDKELGCGHLKQMECCSSTRNAKCVEVVEKDLLCGHKMQMKCCDDISAAKCEQRIFKRLPGCDHKAEMACFDTNFRAIKCQVIVTKVLPECGHRQDVPCFTAVTKMTCKELTSVTLPCGHKCEMGCSEYQNTYNESCNWGVKKKRFPVCHRIITKTLPCKHKISVKCCSKDDLIVCNAQCGITLSCGHSCKGRCRDCFQSLSHLPCNKSCRKKLICGHDCPSLTCGSCRPCQQICLYYCPHTACEHVCGTPCKPCNEPCSWICPHKRCSKICDEPCDRSVCEKRCTKILECMHQCLGFCGEPCPDICSECNPDVIGKLVADSYLSDDTGIIVSLQECGHSFPAEKIDKIVEDSSKSILNVIRCPTCYSIVRWHPRYGHILKKKRKLQNQIKSMTNIKHTGESKTNFPIVRRNFESIINFCRECKTFLLLLQSSLNDEIEEIIQGHRRTTDLASKMLKCLEELGQENLCEQSLHDIFNATYEIAARWMMFIVQHSLNEELDYEDHEVSYEQYKKRRIKKMVVKEAMDILEISSEFTLATLRRIQAVLGTRFDDVEQMALAANYPVFEGVVNVHMEDWRICNRAHLQPSSGHVDCIQCEFGRQVDLEVFMKNKSPYRKSKVDSENPSDVSWKKTYRQGLSIGIDMGNRGGRRKQNTKSKSTDDVAIDNRNYSTDYSKQESLVKQISSPEPFQQNKGYERSSLRETFPRHSPSFESTMETRHQRGGQRGRGHRRGGHRGGRQGNVQRGGMTEVGAQGISHSAIFQEIADQGRGRPENFRGSDQRGRGWQEGTFRRNQRRDDSQEGIWRRRNESGERPTRSRGVGQQRGRNRRRRGGRRN